LREKGVLLEIEFLNNLENKVTMLLSTLESVRKQNTDFVKDLELKSSRISELEAENQYLKQKVEQIESDSSSQQQKLHLTTEKIQGILARLELVQ
jgi:peptidoglycan hydrolase CwlO-like protein